MLYEHKTDPMIGRAKFLARVARHGGVALVIVVVSLLIGMVGYRFLAQQSWIDSLLNSAMLMGGMGPVGNIEPPAGKLFAAAFALYAGFIFIVVSGLLIAPLFHRILHRFHLELGADRKRTTQPADRPRP